VAPAVSLFTATPEWAELGAPHANLNLVAWLQRMEGRPSMKATTSERVAAMAKAA
jgi:glutathione S-transferase